jgi:hypothetical protein
MRWKEQDLTWIEMGPNAQHMDFEKIIFRLKRI